MSKFSQRVRQARDHAKLSQAELAARLKIKQQSIGYLEDPKKGAGGSKYTTAIARACGVDTVWLATGEGAMLPTELRESEASYEALSDDARQVAIAWAKLSPSMQASLQEIIFMLAAAEKHYPWLRRGRPKGESYDEYERRIEQNFEAKIHLVATRPTTR